MAERSLFIPGGFDILHRDHQKHIRNAVTAGQSRLSLNSVVFGLASDKVLATKGKTRPFFSYEWRKDDLEKWFKNESKGTIDFQPFSPERLLRSPNTHPKHALAVLSTEHENTGISAATAMVAEEIIFIPPINTLHATDFEGTLLDTKERSNCDWKVGAVLLRDGQVVGKGHNEQLLPETKSNDDSKEIIHAEIKVLPEAKSGDYLLTTTSPCGDCAEKIVEAGIGRVVYLEPYHTPERAKEPLEFLKDNGVQIRQAGYHPTN